MTVQEQLTPIMPNNQKGAQKFEITGDGVRLRTFPSKENGEIITSLFKRDTVDFYQQSDDNLWSEVAFEDKTGWIYNLYLKPLEPRTSDSTINGILDVVAQSPIRKYNWANRGLASLGYYEGMALMFARLYCRLKNGDNIAKEMARPAGPKADKDALAKYDSIFDAIGMDNDTEGPDTLRHLFTLMVGLGMRESSGRHCEGRDQSADNVTSETAEAGLFQTSYNARSVSTLLPQIFNNYINNPDGFFDSFSKGITCKSKDLENHGDGPGREFQQLSKECPGFAVEFTAIALRNTATHWGPIKNKEVEIRSECDTMFLNIQHFIDLKGINKV
jgi:hypothetical protein